MPTPMTRRGAEKLRAELQRLKSVDRHAVIQAIAEARAQGDLSENAEYEAAKDRQGFIEGRIAEIESKLSSAQVIDPAELHADGRVVLAPPWNCPTRKQVNRCSTRSSATTRPT